MADMNPTAPKPAHTNHDKHYHALMEEAETQILSAFETHGVPLGQVIEKTKIENGDDVEVLLAYVLRHGEPMEVAHMMRWCNAWWMACHELREHKES